MRPTYIISGIPDSVLIIVIITVFVAFFMLGTHYLTHRKRTKRVRLPQDRSTYDLQQHRAHFFEPLFNHPDKVQ